MTNTICTFRSIYTDSGDIGADTCEHNRRCHPDHTHVWGDSPYAHEQEGKSYFQWPETLLRQETVQRCTVCAVLPTDVRECK